VFDLDLSIMGTLAQMTGSKSPSPLHLQEYIDRLRNCSLQFVTFWQQEHRDLQSAERVSRDAFQLFDHIANSIIRARDEMRDLGSLTGSRLEADLGSSCGFIVRGVTAQDQVDLRALPPGNGQLPANSHPDPMMLIEILNKFKHHKPEAGSFRIDPPATHILALTANQNHKPESIFEFPVDGFCRLCSNIAGYI
jgi:hypothetical protein